MCHRVLWGGILALGSAHKALCDSSRSQTPRNLPGFWCEVASNARAQLNKAGEGKHFRIFNSKGEKSSLGEVLDAIREADVVLLGETHDDVIAHQLELYILLEAAADALRRNRSIAVSLEMFETDVQEQLSEYLAGLIPEKDMLRDSRPWPNYRDYRFMVEFAKDAGFPVIAANAPRRYVAACAKRGKSALLQFPESAVRRYLAPLPLPPPSEAYIKHFQVETLDSNT